MGKLYKQMMINKNALRFVMAVVMLVSVIGITSAQNILTQEELDSFDVENLTYIDMGCTVVGSGTYPAELPDRWFYNVQCLDVEQVQTEPNLYEVTTTIINVEYYFDWYLFCVDEGSTSEQCINQAIDTIVASFLNEVEELKDRIISMQTPEETDEEIPELPI